MKILLFTDIDGTLIDHHTYSTFYAKKALNRLEGCNIPVIFCSSKTTDEQLYLQHKLGIQFPFIVENGSAIIFPKNYMPSQTQLLPMISDSHCQLVLAKNTLSDMRAILGKLQKLPNRSISSYANCTEREIAKFTALGSKAVKRAKNRQFTETLFLENLQVEDWRTLEEAGFYVSKGGRFKTIQDKQTGKGIAVNRLVSFFEEEWNEEIMTIGVGDSPNDISFLRVVHKPYLVQKHDGLWTDIAEIDGLTKINAVGAKGFLQMIDKIKILQR